MIDGWWWLVFSFNPIGEQKMTVPTTPPTTSAKAVVSAIGAVLMVLVPILQSVAGILPPPWGAIIAGFIGLLTVFGVWKTPNKSKV